MSAEPSERRAYPRSKVLLEAEIFPIAGYAEVRIAETSRTDFTGETAASLRPSQPLIVSVRENDFHKATVRWVRGRRFGADLDDALGILGPSIDVNPGSWLSHEAYSRRHLVPSASRIVLGSRSHPATVLDVSQSGLRLQVKTMPEIGQELLVRLSNRPLILATVRWRAAQMIGVETAERMQTLRLVYGDH